MKLLIIDDEPIVLQNVKAQILSMNMSFEGIDTANSAAAADELMTENTYDIFLCDIVMPGEDGISFAKRILQNNTDCKFIFLTA
ncbi:MAG: response regulator, partial [Lachnospiraceae bacterium]|nr:response regulator [Lachnospiraceae bacterium]